MTPREEAKELVQKFEIEIICNLRHFKHEKIILKKVAKQCALICVDVKMKGLPNINQTAPDFRDSDECYFQYWQEVKKEIQKI